MLAEARCSCRYLFIVGMLLSQYTLTGYDA